MGLGGSAYLVFLRTIVICVYIFTNSARVYFLFKLQKKFTLFCSTVELIFQPFVEYVLASLNHRVLAFVEVFSAFKELGSLSGRKVLWREGQKSPRMHAESLSTNFVAVTIKFCFFYPLP